MKKAYIKHLISLLLFGSNGIITANLTVSSSEIVFFRTLIGSAVLMLFFIFTCAKPQFIKHKKSALFIAVSGVSMGASWMFLFEGFKQIGVSVSTLIYYCGPVIVMVLSPFIFKEKLTLIKVVGFITVLCGLFLINGISTEKINPFGIFCGIMSAVTYSVMVVTNKKSTGISGLENSLIQMIFAFLTVFIFLVFKNGLSLEITASQIPAILIIGILNTGVGCYFYFSSIGLLPVQTVSVCGYLEPLSALIFSFIFLKEKLLPLQLLGAFLIIGGAFLGEILGNKNFRNRKG